ncbi:DNA polymerase III subunit beta, partial [Staphylococcus haemolyticus]
MMEFTIRRYYFINQLNDTLKAISPRTTLPILKGIKIDAKDKEVILTGSDTEIYIEITKPKQLE